MVTSSTQNNSKLLEKLRSGFKKKKKKKKLTEIDINQKFQQKNKMNI